MNGKILIIAGGIILLLLLGVWGYLLFFGTPQDADDVFANFGFGPADDPSIVTTTEPTPEPQPVVDVEGPRLRQLTTRPVVGYVEVATSTTTPDNLYYAEAGTGHIYRINLESGEGVRVSNTTIPSAHDAVFSEDASVMVARSGFSSSNDVVVGIRGTSSLETSVLPETILDYTVRDNTLFYLTPVGGGAAGRVLDVTTFSGRELFTLPFSQAHMLWGETANDTHYVYTKPSRELEGYLYSITDGALGRIISGNGLVAELGPEHIVYSADTGRGYVGAAITKTNSSESLLPITTIPEKCDFGDIATSTFWCAQAQPIDLSDYPESWYKGTEQTSDILWELNTTDGSATVLVNLEQESGRAIDVTDLTVAPGEDALYFINRLDNTLWTYEL